MKRISPDEHPFLTQPHRTLLALSFPVLLSQIAEPLTGLVDTAFIAQLGTTPLAAVGIGAVMLSGTFWIFNFLGIGTQTGVAQAMGQRKHDQAVHTTSLALAMAFFFSFVMMILGWLTIEPLTHLLGGEGAVQINAMQYLQVRLLGAPAALGMMVGFGALRGMQDMKTPLWIAAAVNVMNIMLDAPLIFGLGPIPALGVPGSALATIASQYVGLLWVLIALRSKLGYTRSIRLRDALDLIQVGGDLFIRTGLLTIYLILATRAANQINVESGAAHQAITQVWGFSAFALDALALTAQSLVGYFIGAGEIDMARKAAKYSAWWCFGVGFVLAAAMLLLTNRVIGVLVPEEAAAIFIPAWIIAAVAQPLNSLAFVTDGIHWGTGDYRYLRNSMVTATLCGAAALFFIGVSGHGTLLYVWIATGLWIVVRSVIGMIRVWPGIGKSPLRPKVIITA